MNEDCYNCGTAMFPLCEEHLCPGCCNGYDEKEDVYEKWASIAQEKLFNFNLERMKQAVEGETISIPTGLTREERREWIRDRLKEVEGNQ